MANEVKIILQAVDKASAEINKVTTAGDKLSAGFKSLTGMSLGAGAAIAGIGAAAKWIKDAVDQTVQYATEIDNMSRLLGISTEDTSRLVQASDDLFISQEKLSSGLQAATRQGIDVSIDGLKRLSEQYLALPNGVERSTFVLKTFGRSGAEMAKLMEQGADGIDAATAAIADNMVITQKSMTDIMNYKRSVDNLNDSWQGVKYTVGSEIIPQLDLLMRAMTAGKDEVEIQTQAVNRLELQYDRAASAAAIGNKAAAASMQEIGAKIAWLTGEYGKGEVGVSDFYAGISNMAPQAVEAMTSLSDAIIPVTTYFSDLTTEMLFNQAAAGLDAEASMALAGSMGLIDGETKLVLDALAKLRAEYDKTGDLEEYNRQVGILNERMALIQSKTVTITVRTSFEGQTGLWGQYNNAYIGLAKSNQATGGLGGGRTLVGEFGPEVVDLPPGSRVHNATNSAGMGSSNVSIDYDRMGRALVNALVTSGYIR